MILRPILAAVVLAAGCGFATAPHPAVGRSVGPLRLVLVADGSRPAPTCAGKVTLLTLWATWCPPCRRELPGLARLAGRLADDPRFQLVAIACDDEPVETLAATVSRFLASQRIDLDSWVDPNAAMQATFARELGFSSLPTSYLIGPDGRVRQVWVGYRGRDEADMARAVLAALKDVSPASGATPAVR